MEWFRVSFKFKLECVYLIFEINFYCNFYWNKDSTREIKRY